ncbi:MAG TPA: formylglycine-generating enzyme family protein [Phnomibacter sp.]|nr:formylglycine-generating enzyme family protein [Phnomibacter sp.]
MPQQTPIIKKIAIGLVVFVLLVVLSLVVYRFWPDGQTVRENDAFAKPDLLHAPEGMVWVEGGQFEMGTDDATANPEEQPAHPVRVDGFWMMDHEITNKEFAAYLDSTHNADGYKDSMSVRATQLANFPVVNLSWNDALNYCAWAGLRLPTEAEWEFAVKGQQHNQTLASPQWLGNFSTGKIAAVKSYAPNAYQLYDLPGNVWEWCGDFYDAAFHKKYGTEILQSNIYGADNSVDSSNTAPVFRVIKGGSFLSAPNEAVVKRSTARRSANADSGYTDVGFRPVMTTSMWEVKKRLHAAQ